MKKFTDFVQPVSEAITKQQMDSLMIKQGAEYTSILMESNDDNSAHVKIAIMAMNKLIAGLDVPDRLNDAKIILKELKTLQSNL